jgi:hypothetical protein
VFKAASTSWMYNFNLLAGYSPMFLKKSQKVPLTLARKKYPRPSVKEVSVISLENWLIITFFLEKNNDNDNDDEEKGSFFKLTSS